MNALKHGMAAEEVVIPGENPAELRVLHRNMIAAWKPVGAVEEKLVWEIAIADWRLRRARRMEAKLVEIGSARSEGRGRWNLGVAGAISAAVSASSDAHMESDGLIEGEVEGRNTQPESDEPDDGTPDPDRSALYAAERFFDSEGGLGAMQQLLRYEAAAERSYYRAIHTLERFQARRMGTNVSPPKSRTCTPTNNNRRPDTPTKSPLLGIAGVLADARLYRGPERRCGWTLSSRSAWRPSPYFVHPDPLSWLRTGWRGRW
jgi:hypothetical protein